MSNPIYSEVRVVPNKFKSNPVNPMHELGFLKPKQKSTMNSVFKSSKSVSEIQEENLPTVLSSISKGFQNDKTHKVSDFKALGFMVATECVRSGSNTEANLDWFQLHSSANEPKLSLHANPLCFLFHLVAKIMLNLLCNTH